VPERYGVLRGLQCGAGTASSQLYTCGPIETERSFTTGLDGLPLQPIYVDFDEQRKELPSVVADDAIREPRGQLSATFHLAERSRHCCYCGQPRAFTRSSGRLIRSLMLLQLTTLDVRLECLYS
jgi:hypothetical protein